MIGLQNALAAKNHWFRWNLLNKPLLRIAFGSR